MSGTGVVSARLSIFFFFSSRRRHTRLQGDWSSDVCSSDLFDRPRPAPSGGIVKPTSICLVAQSDYQIDPRVRRKGEALVAAGYSVDVLARSEERRVGKECRSRWSPYH